MSSHPTSGSGPPATEISPFFRTEAAADAAMTYFYGRLFASDPEFRTMFPASLAAQRHRLYHALCRIAAATPGPAGSGSDPEPGSALDEYLAELGRTHRKFGVRPEHYGPFTSALEATLAKFPPDAGHWTEPEWTAALRHAATIMSRAAEAVSGPAWWTAEVVSNEPRTRYVTVLTLRPAEPYPYLPGQHAAVQAPRWPRVWRPYSIANAPGHGDGDAPGGDGTITLHVRVIPGGLVSTALLHAAPGDTLLLGGAEGTMTADTASPRDALCLAGGTGLAPLKAIAQALLTRPADGPRVTLYFGARTEADLYDLPALRAMERRSPALEVRVVTSEEHSPRALHAMISTLADDAEWPGRDIYISGPDAMIARTVRRLRGRGVPSARLRYDLPQEASAGGSLLSVP